MKHFMKSRSHGRARYRFTKRFKILTTVTMIILVMIVSISITAKSMKVSNSFTKGKITGATGDNLKTYVVKKGDLSTTITGIGNFVALKSTSLYFGDVTGPLDELYVGMNEEVKAGATIAKILPGDLEYKISLQKLELGSSLLKLSQLEDQITDIKKSIETSMIDYNTIIKSSKSQSEKNNEDLKKARLSVYQLQAQLLAMEKDKAIAQVDIKSVNEIKQASIVQQAKLKLQQIDNDIASITMSIDIEKIDNNGYKKSSLVSSQNNDEGKKSDLRLSQLQIQLDTANKNREIAEIDLKNQQDKSQKLVEQRANIKLQQTNDQLNGISKSIEAARMAVNEVPRNSKDQRDQITADIKKTKITLMKLKLQLDEIEKSKKLAALDVTIAKLNLNELERKLRECTLISPINGIVTFVDNIYRTDLIDSGRVIAKVTKPTDIAMQFSSGELSTLSYGMKVKVIIKDKIYDSSVYKPQAGDLINGDGNASSEKNHVFLVFDKGLKDFKINDQLDAKIQVVGRENILTVPKSAIKSDGAKYWVDAFQNGKIEEIRIQRGMETITDVEVKNGLKEGEKVILPY